MSTLLFLGDFSPQGRLARIHEMDPREVFGSFLSIIREADLACLNLEAPLCIPSKSIAKTGPALHGRPEVVNFLKLSGFDLACLANNHILDYGADGLKETMLALRNAGISQVGAGHNYTESSKPFVADVNELKVGILNFAENEWSTSFDYKYGACPIDPVRNFSAIQSAKRQVNRLIVVCHGGHEGYRLPSPSMQELFRFYVDAGADAVINHHTHCISGFEVYSGAPIFYSVGNFLFDNSKVRRGRWTEGLAIALSFNGNDFDFKLYHFSQCTDEALFYLADDEESIVRDSRLKQLNDVISNPEILAESFENFISDRQHLYRGYLEPKLPRFLGAAQRRRWLPSLISRRHRMLLLNLIRCESHREIIVKLLSRDAGHTQ